MKKFIVLFALFTCVTCFADEALASPWKAWVGTILDPLIPVIGTALAGLVALILAQIAKKFNIELSEAQKHVVDDAVEKAMNYADEWAQKLEKTPTGDAKLDTAVLALQAILANDIVKKYTVDQLRILIEAKLFATRGVKKW